MSQFRGLVIPKREIINFRERSLNIYSLSRQPESIWWCTMSMNLILSSLSRQIIEYVLTYLVSDLDVSVDDLLADSGVGYR
jgi:hypothetical protein